MPSIANQIETAKKDRFDLIQRQRSIVNAVDAEKREMTTEERAEFDTLSTSVDGHETRLKDLERINDADDVDDEGDRGAEGGDEGDRSGDPEGDVRDALPNGSRRSGRPIGAEPRDGGPRPGMPNSGRRYVQAFRKFLLTGEVRDVVMGTATAGGNLLAPIEVSDDIVKQIDNSVYIRRLAKITNLANAQALGVRTMTNRLSPVAWTSEVGQLTPDTSLAFGQRTLTPNLLARLVTVSLRIMASGAGQDVEDMIKEELAYQFSVVEENAYLNGTGTGQPLGVFVASNVGVPTSQDYTSTVAGDFKADDLVGMRYALKQGYLRDDKAAWIFSRPIAQEIRTFKDNYGAYIWRPGLATNAPDTVLDIPYGISEYAPSAKATGNYIAVLGNWSYYRIAQVRIMEIQRLVERYADINEIGFIGRRYLDGAPILGEAFVRLKCM